MSERQQNKPGPSTTGKRFRKFLPAVIVLAVLAIVVVVWQLPARDRQEPARPPAPVNVEVMTIRPIDEMPETFEIPGVVEPNVVVEVSAEVEGRIEEIRCREGRRCAKGDPLIRLNTDLLQAAYDRDKAQAEFDQREYERVKQLRDRGVATASEVDQARTKAAASKAAFDESAARLARTVITAPAGGILDDVPVERGEYVGVGQVVARIVDIEKVKVVVDAPELDVHYLQVGQEGEISTDALNGKPLTGRITYISELADPRTRTSRVEITVDNHRRFLRSGQIVRVRLRRRILKEVVLVPLAAVIPMEEGKVVYVAQGDHAERREVRLGVIRGWSVQILDGLWEGDKLIVAGHRFVSPGQKIRIVAERSEDQP